MAHGQANLQRKTYCPCIEDTIQWRRPKGLHCVSASESAKNAGNLHLLTEGFVALTANSFRRPVKHWRRGSVFAMPASAHRQLLLPSYSAL